MKPPREKSGRVRSWTTKGLGRVDLDSKTVDLFGIYPAEDVDILVGRSRNAWLKQIRAPHPARVEARCPHFGVCGGCTIMTIGLTEQLRIKAEPVQALLQSLDRSVQWDPPVPSPQPYYYRTKVEFSFLRDRLGFHQRGRFDMAVGVRECFIGPPHNRALLAITRRWQKDHGLAGWNPRSQAGDLRYLLVRHSASTGQWLALLVTAPHVPRAAVQDWADRLVAAAGCAQGPVAAQPAPELVAPPAPELVAPPASELVAQPSPEFAATLGSLTKPTGLLAGTQSSTASALVLDGQTGLYGSPEIVEELHGIRYRLHWRSFFQSNPPAYSRLLTTAREWVAIQKGQTVLDLYCGIGTIGLSLTPPDARLIGVECVAEAIEDASRAAQENGRTAEFHVHSAHEWPNLECDLLILDPPRSGCHPKMLDHVVQKGPRRVLYISCNPHRFAEEWLTLGQAYRIERGQLFDFFPQTRHIEALVMLTRRDP